LFNLVRTAAAFPRPPDKRPAKLRRDPNTWPGDWSATLRAILRPAKTFLSEWREVRRKAIYKTPNPQRSQLRDRHEHWQDKMARLIKALVFLAVIAFLGLVGYAYLGDLSPDQSEMREPVQLDVGQ
jgi:hypothetical protein